MRRNLLCSALLNCIFLSPLLRADCTGNNDQRSSDSSGILISDWKVVGTQTLSSIDGTDPRSQTLPKDIDCKSSAEVIDALKKINPHQRN
jgi:hypothetical protein